MLAVARAVRSGWRWLRFRAWALRLRFRLRRLGGRLDLELAGTPTFDSPPIIEAIPVGAAGGVLALRIGRGVHLGRGLILEVWTRSDSRLEIGDRVAFQRGIRLMIRGGSIEFAPGSDVRDGVLIKANGGRISLGERGTIGAYTLVHGAERVQLDDLVGIGERSTIVDSDHGFDGTDTFFRDASRLTGPIHIERNTFVAANSVVLHDVRIGRNSVVAANSVVTEGEYPPSSLIAGAPAEPIKTITPNATQARTADPG
jgi:acetyltransferase-like isoleucine patch superfamily enzyme